MPFSAHYAGMYGQTDGQTDRGINLGGWITYRFLQVKIALGRVCLVDMLWFYVLYLLSLWARDGFCESKVYGSLPSHHAFLPELLGCWIRIASQ
jgi:hypothetical protein